MDRYVNTRVLECLSRPQYDYSCGLTALTCVVNYLYTEQLGIVKQEQLARCLGFEASEAGLDGGPGNEELLEWFLQFIRTNNLNGSGEVVLTGESMPAAGSKTYEQMIAHMKELIRSPDSILVYHAANHYRPICGYFESAKKPEEAFAADPEVNRWLLIADHDDDEDPVQCVRLWKVREELSEWEGNGILLFKKGR